MWYHERYHKWGKQSQTIKCLCSWKAFWIILVHDVFTLAPYIRISLPNIKSGCLLHSTLLVMMICSHPTYSMAGRSAFVSTSFYKKDIQSILRKIKQFSIYPHHLPERMSTFPVDLFYDVLPIFLKLEMSHLPFSSPSLQ